MIICPRLPSSEVDARDQTHMALSLFRGVGGLSVHVLSHILWPPDHIPHAPANPCLWSDAQATGTSGGYSLPGDGVWDQGHLVRCWEGLQAHCQFFKAQGSPWAMGALGSSRGQQAEPRAQIQIENPKPGHLTKGQEQIHGMPMGQGTGAPGPLQGTSCFRHPARGTGLSCPEEKMPEPQPGPTDPFRAFS